MLIGEISYARVFFPIMMMTLLFFLPNQTININTIIYVHYKPFSVLSFFIYFWPRHVDVSVPIISDVLEVRGWQ